jgi:GNAT superfamily N-acetyltransferase
MGTLSNSVRATRDQYRIVPAGDEHLGAIPGIELAAARLFSEEDLPPHIRYRVTDRDVLVAALNDARLWVGLDAGGTAVAYAMAGAMGADAFLDEVDVQPDHGRRGIGTALVRTVISWARERDYPSLLLLTFRHLPWNAPFYKSLGFHILAPHELSAGLRDQLHAEKEAGIDVRKRVAMRMVLN